MSLRNAGPVRSNERIFPRFGMQMPEEVVPKRVGVATFQAVSPVDEGRSNRRPTPTATTAPAA
jgi:hypothetical protein